MIRPYRQHQPQLAAGVFVDPQAAVIGQVQLGEDVSVWPFASVRGDVHRIEIGARSNVQDNAVLHVTHDGPYSPGGVPLLIGADVTIGHGVILHACTIGDRCLIGMGSIVLDRAIIEDEVLLAAGSMVPPGKRLESGWLYRGSPATQVRRLSDSELAHFRYSTAHYVKLKNEYLQQQAAG